MMLLSRIIRPALQRQLEEGKRLAKVCGRCSDVDIQMWKQTEGFARLILKDETERQTLYS